MNNMRDCATIILLLTLQLPLPCVSGHAVLLLHLLIEKEKNKIFEIQMNETGTPKSSWSPQEERGAQWAYENVLPDNMRED